MSQQVKSSNGNYYNTINEMNNCMNESRENAQGIDTVKDSQDVVLVCSKR